MNAPATSIDSVTGDLVVSWTQPDQQGSNVLSYFIELSSSDGQTWTEYQSTCDGDDPSLLECAIPMNQLDLIPYLYEQTNIIYVRTSAYNEFGSSLVSEANQEGALLRTPPHKMNIVLSHSDTRKDLLRVEWIAPTSEESGDSNILSYKLVWNAGSGAVD